MFELLIPIALLIALLAIGTPVGFAMAGAGIVGIWAIDGFATPAALLATGPHGATQGFSLTALPMFILMAEFLGASTIVGRMFEAARAWVGRLPGGLAIATVGAGAGLGTISGSSVASTASLSRICIPEMRKSGYDDRLSMSSVASAGTLAVMIPPSVPLLMYGITTETSIVDLFTAGILPGIILAVLFALTIVVWQKMRPGIAPLASPSSWRERFATLQHTGPALLLVLIVLGGMYSGIVTATEAGAVGALGALIVAYIFGNLRWSGMLMAMRRTVEVTAAVFIIVIGAKLFTQFLTLTGITQDLTRAIGESAIPSLLVIVLIFAIYAVLGCFMDGIGMMLLTLPVFFPLVVGLGYDPIWFGIMVALVIELGLITPPIGLNVYIASGTSGGNLGLAFKGVTRFYVAAVITAALMVAFPEIVTYLPSLRG
ncbi:C4-dicarboxylate ABC transporter permease [Rhodococcus sp. ACPA4]|uniref:TRAP transporter large permease n=1 Tax=Rhodococcus sp. ACPA4 TaxID=2028571 RepID=UPI000BB136AA|nr:TRAP transporter large permease [Rhodococcus sp. ACPA4]PBC43764.1 C4-dicarboxylate ABC transporter permease [Rhodococcus sp. ACPA4]